MPCCRTGPRALARRARAMVHEQYGWSAIASRTAAAYGAAIAGDAAFTAERAEERMTLGRALPALPEGKLLAAAGLR
ncbi:hypothetical protein [Micromonospora viridifaciens]|uniref:hypothetical protein n=1 Tax=Micromonospora viridifaciens TaxID=1881 RepID=UPI001E3A8FDF|nr:hypothetical protein [Micromonospora viridifaciens]